MLPRESSMLAVAPLNQPLAGSYLVVETRRLVGAARGMLAPLNDIPPSVVVFWSAPKPSTEMPPLIDDTPGTVDDIAARSPASSEGTAAIRPSGDRCAAPVGSPPASERSGFGLVARTVTTAI